MTKKRDLKRRVRERQAATGESYVTARRRVLGARAMRPGGRDGAGDAGDADQSARRTEGSDDPVDLEATLDADPATEGVTGPAPMSVSDLIALRGSPVASVATSAPAPSPLSVVELANATAAAAHLGFRCQISVFPSLLERAELAAMLTALRDALVHDASPSSARLFAAAFGVAPPEPRAPLGVLARLSSIGIANALSRTLRSTIVGALHPESVMAFRVVARDDRLVSVMCILDREQSLVLTQVDDLLHVRELRGAVTPPPLYVIHDGKRHAITGDEFLIGRSRHAHLSIRDGRISRRHAAVVRKHGFYYLQDLGSTDGILHRGMRIGHKRIADGDVFEVGGHELRFTYDPDA